LFLMNWTVLIASSIPCCWPLLGLTLYSRISTNASLLGRFPNGDFQHGRLGNPISFGQLLQDLSGTAGHSKSGRLLVFAASMQ